MPRDLAQVDLAELGRREDRRKAERQQAQRSAYVAHMQARFLQDILDQATADFWDRRAQVWDSAAPRPGDFTGRATPEQLVEQSRRCHAISQSCRRHAQMLRNEWAGDIEPLVWRVLWETM